MYLSLIAGQSSFESDTIITSGGDLGITFISHGSLRFDYQQKIIYVDPCSRFADYSGLPKADLILITHHHFDHLDSALISQLSKSSTQIVGTTLVAESLPGVTIMTNGDTLTTVGRIPIRAVPAYNLIHQRDSGGPFHPKGEDNGYVITFSDTKVYVASDTENIPEMIELTDIHIAFLPMNLPYTMTPEMVVDAVSKFHPKILYPYHTGDTDIQVLIDLLSDVKDCEVRVRALQ